jgi:hypothetical protein
MPPAVDIAVDPLDGTTLTAQGRSGAIAVSGSNCECIVSRGSVQVVNIHMTRACRTWVRSMTLVHTQKMQVALVRDDMDET